MDGEILFMSALKLLITSCALKRLKMILRIKLRSKRKNCYAYLDNSAQIFRVC
jgi:hypothetical protein